jgi:hypothetical protein
MKKKILTIIAILLLACISIPLFLYSVEPAVNYSLNAYSYRKVDGNWCMINYLNSQTYNQTFTTLHCKNSGVFNASYSVIVTFSNANVTQNPSHPYEIIDGTTAKLSYTLQSQEIADRDVCFSVDSNITSFEITISLQTGQFFMRSSEANWGGQNTFYYDEFSNGTFTPAMIA